MLKIEQVPVPEIKDNQVLVRAHYAGVNFIDSYYREGLYKITKFPHILGSEGSGEIVQVGSKVTNFKVGDRVGYITGQTYQQYVPVDANAQIVPIPDSVDLRTVAAVFIQGMTAATFTKESYEIKKGDTVLIHAAAGGTGGLLVQFAKLRGARVIGTTSTPEKAEIAKTNGADEVILYRTENVAERVAELTNSKGVEAVYDSVGKDTWDISLASVARKGTIISMGNASGPVPPISLLSLAPKNVKVLRPRVYGYISTKEELNHYASELWQFIASGQVKVNISKEFQIMDYKEAIAFLQSGKSTGKLIVKIY